jgi:signal transduction histidine kinase
VTFFVSLFLFGSVYLYMFHLNLYEDYQDSFGNSRQQIESHLQDAEENNWDSAMVASSLQILLRQDNRSIYLYDSAGELLYQPSPGDGAFIGINSSVVEEVLAGEEIAQGMRINGDLMYLIAAPFQAGPEQASEDVMIMVFHELDHEIRQAVLMILFAIFITILCAGVILWFISRRLTLPLREMNKIAMKLAKGDFSQRVKIRSKDEIGQLGETFNTMAEDLDSLEQMRKDFLANVSHDLRSPLTSINGFLTALLDGTIPDSRKGHYYKLMKDETDRLIKLVNDLLHVNQLEAGKIVIQPADYNLSEQLRITAAKMEPQLSKKQIELELIGTEVDIMVNADQNRMEQVFINLLQNAVNFSTTGSKVLIKLKKENDRVKISIKDHGIGMDEEELNHIWDRFYKADSARSRKSGTGLGLSIVKSILELHGVSIKAESKRGAGTVFSFKLPLA